MIPNCLLIYAPIICYQLPSLSSVSDTDQSRCKSTSVRSSSTHSHEGKPNMIIYTISRVGRIPSCLTIDIISYIICSSLSKILSSAEYLRRARIRISLFETILIQSYPSTLTEATDIQRPSLMLIAVHCNKLISVSPLGSLIEVGSATIG